jgi:signal transduction histidine kinase
MQDMSFLEEVREYLTRPWAATDFNDYRRFFLSLLEHLEKQGAPLTRLSKNRKEIAPKLDSYTYKLERRLMDEGLLSRELPTLVESAIAREVGHTEPYSVTATRSLILQEAREGLLESIDADDQLHTVPKYARENRLVEDYEGEIVPSQIGTIALELSGRDAIRWLLNVEVALSTGPGDPWRIDRETLKLFATKNGITPLGSQPINFASMRRMVGFGLVDEIAPLTFLLQPHARPLLQEICEETDSPMALLVSSALEDDLGSRLPGQRVVTATESLARQTKLVVHEIRNALIPVQEALRSVDRAAKGAGLESSIEPYRGRIDSSVGRLLRFADELQDVASLAREAQDAFNPVSATRDAIMAIAAEVGKPPTLRHDEAMLPVIGVRSRFMLAVLNLLRNAYQAAPENNASVAVDVATHEGRVRIVIDDNGPGFTIEHRERIFVDGYSMRRGGSGHGLALARTAIEDEMRGTLSCEDGSSLGGGRFVITLPPHNGSAR